MNILIINSFPLDEKYSSSLLEQVSKILNKEMTLEEVQNYIDEFEYKINFDETEDEIYFKVTGNRSEVLELGKMKRKEASDSDAYFLNLKYYLTRPNLIGMMDEIEGMEEQTVLDNIHRLQYSIDIYNGNRDEVLKILEEGTHPDNHIKYYAQHNRDNFGTLRHEVLRTFHNFIAGSYSLYEAIHVFMTYYRKKDENFYRKEYEPVYKSLPNSPIYEFILGLRILIQHLKTPNVSFTNNWTPSTGLVTRIIFDKQHTDNFVRLSVVGKTYLNNFSDHIELEQIIHEHNEFTQDYVSNFLNKLKELHKDDFKVLNDKKREARKHLIPQILSATILMYNQTGVFENLFSSIIPSNKLKQIDSLHILVPDKIKAYIDFIEQDIKLDEDLKNELFKIK
jgi:hypothetical protein